MNELQIALSAYLLNHPGSELELAKEFQVANSTVNRWANGTARPHPRLAQMIVNYIKSKSQTG